MGLADAFAMELEQEAKTTRRVLERVPSDRFAWRPHDKSMTLGKLAMHVAEVPGTISSWALKDVMEFSGQPAENLPKTTADLLTAHDASLAKAKQALQQLGDSGLQQKWEGKAGGQTLMTLPKLALIRSVLLNHWIHHRGQLSVYLRLLDVPVPSIYGPSADEAAFRG
jgi:uncharacterized damage-inducible protein DinB